MRPTIRRLCCYDILSSTWLNIKYCQKMSNRLRNRMSEHQCWDKRWPNLEKQNTVRNNYTVV